jgi:hypothetical protein
MLYYVHFTLYCPLCTLYIFPDFSKFISQVKDDMFEADVTPVNSREHVYYTVHIQS